MHYTMQKTLPATVRLITAEEFAEMPDDNYSYELVRGRLVQMPKPSIRHARVAHRLFMPLSKFVDDRGLGWVSTIDMGFLVERHPDTVRATDIWFLRSERVPGSDAPDTFAPGAPDLAVEVRSKTDRRRELFEKAHEYLAHGTSLVWVIDPKLRVVWEFRPGQPERELTEGDDLDGADVLPGFHFPIKQLLYTSDGSP